MSIKEKSLGPVEAVTKRPLFALALAASPFFYGRAQADITYSDLYTLGKPVGYTFARQGSLRTATGFGENVGYGWGAATNNSFHALLWKNSATPIDLHPSGFASSEAQGITSTQQVGRGSPSVTGLPHAMLWTGTAASAIDLHPTTGFASSEANGAGGMQQVGKGFVSSTGTQGHALLWAGSAASVVDLHPTGFTTTQAWATNGTQQVGEGSGTATGNQTHAMLWRGTAASAVDLHPSSLLASQAYGAGGLQQVGVGYGSVTGNQFHALLWAGTAASVIDLNPIGFDYTQAFGTNGALQVGLGTGQATDGDPHAIAWIGTASSYIDLGALLPTSFLQSFAYSVDGTTVYGLALDSGGNYHAVAWNNVPEPTSLAVAGMFGLLLARRRHRGNPEMSLLNQRKTG